MARRLGRRDFHDNQNHNLWVGCWSQELYRQGNTKACDQLLQKF